MVPPTDECEALGASPEPAPERPVDAVLRRLARAVRFRDEETAEHVERMSRACALIASELGWMPSGCIRLRAAAALHDIGKIGVPDALLRKPGPLTPDERTQVEAHPEIGFEILAGETDPVLRLAASVALHHHERVDGTGYPRGLRGDQIPIEGRIAAAADVFDALTHDRSYRPAFSHEEALGLMQEHRGSHFDPQVFDAFLAVLGEVLGVSELYPDSLGSAPPAPRPEQPCRARPTTPKKRRDLTPREREVVSLLAVGLTGEMIGERLFLSSETVRTHIRNAMQRLGARTRAHLVMLAADRGQITRDQP